jgi:Fusaric acid resistance protein-like
MMPPAAVGLGNVCAMSELDDLESRSRLGRALGSTGAPAQWPLVLHLVAGLLAGAGLGSLLSPTKGAVLAGLTGALVAGAGASLPSAIAMRVGVFAAVTTVVSMSVAFATGGDPVLAALAMAAMAILTSAAAAAGPVGASLGTLGSLAYLLVAALGRLAHLYGEVSFPSGLARILIGCVAGLLVVSVRVAWRRSRAPRASGPANLPVAPVRAVWTSVRTLDRSARDGIRRAIPLAIGIYLFETYGTKDALWIFVAAFVVLLPTSKLPREIAAARVISSVVGVVLLGLLALVVPRPALLGCAAVAILMGMAYSRRYPIAASGLTAMGAILLTGAPAGAIGTWAGHRVLDTLVGAGLALAATYLLWPRDEPTSAARAG